MTHSPARWMLSFLGAAAAAIATPAASYAESIESGQNGSTATSTVCRPSDTEITAGSIVVDAQTGHAEAKSLTLAQPDIRVVLVNKNPFRFSYSVVADSKVAASAAPALITALAQWAGVPAFVTAALPSAADLLAGAAGEVKLFGVMANDPAFNAVASEWRIPAGCAEAGQARPFLTYLREREGEHNDLFAEVKNPSAAFAAMATSLNETLGAVKIVNQDGVSCSVALENGKVIGRFEVDKVARQAVTKMQDAVRNAGAAAEQIREAVTFYENAFPSTCMVPAVLRLKKAALFDPEIDGKAVNDVVAAIPKAEAAAKSAGDIVENPNAFHETRVVHVGDQPSVVHAVVRRIREGEKGDGELLTDARFEVGDTRRISTSAGFLTGRGHTRERYQPVLQTGVAAPVVDSAPPATATPASKSVVGLERRSGSLVIPVALINFRPSLKARRFYISGGAGPSGESGTSALAYFIGASFSVGSRIMLTGGHTWTVAQVLPHGLALGAPLPDGTESIATEKRLAGVWTYGIAVGLW